MRKPCSVERVSKNVEICKVVFCTQVLQTTSVSDEAERCGVRRTSNALGYMLYVTVAALETHEDEYSDQERVS